MNCIGFPKMFSNNTTNIYKGNQATRNCIHLLLSSEVGELFGDPEFGIRLKKFTYNQNNYVLRDILIDEIFTQLNLFCPQVSLTRNDIKIRQDGHTLYAVIKAINKVDFTTSTYNLVLLEEEDR